MVILEHLFLKKQATDTETQLSQVPDAPPARCFYFEVLCSFSGAPAALSVWLDVPLLGVAMHWGEAA